MRNPRIGKRVNETYLVTQRWPYPCSHVPRLSKPPHHPRNMGTEHGMEARRNYLQLSDTHPPSSIVLGGSMEHAQG